MSSEYANPNCRVCGGVGFVYPACLYTRPGQQGGRFCDCALDSLRLVNMDRVWPSLSTAKEFPGLREDPPLRLFLQKNLWITATVPVFRAHLKALAYTRPTLWDCRVYPDAELITSWLGTAKAEGIRIYDLDADKSTLEAIDLRDLVEPPELVILLLGVKQLPNKEAPNSLLEAIGYRQHASKPLWIVDQPDHRIDFVQHRFYSETLEGWLKHWPHVQIVGRRVRKAGGPVEAVDAAAGIQEIDAALDSKIEQVLGDLSDEEGLTQTDGNDSEDEDDSENDAPAEEESKSKGRETKSYAHKLRTEVAPKGRTQGGRGRR